MAMRFTHHADMYSSVFFCMQLPSINHLVNSWRGKRGHLCGILLPPLIQAMVQNSVIPTGFTVLLKTACGLFRQHSSAGQWEFKDNAGVLCCIAHCFIVLHRYCIFLQIEDLWQPCIEQVYECHFSGPVCSLQVSVSKLHFGNSHSVSPFFVIIIVVMVICDQQSLMLLSQKDDNSLKAEMMVSIFEQ